MRPQIARRSDDGDLIHDAILILLGNFAQVPRVGLKIVPETFADLASAFPNLVHNRSVSRHVSASQGCSMCGVASNGTASPNCRFSPSRRRTLVALARWRQFHVRR